MKVKKIVAGLVVAAALSALSLSTALAAPAARLTPNTGSINLGDSFDTVVIESAGASVFETPRLVPSYGPVSMDSLMDE